MNLQGTHYIAAECIFNASCIEALVVYILIQVPPPFQRKRFENKNKSRDRNYSANIFGSMQYCAYVSSE